MKQEVVLHAYEGAAGIPNSLMQEDITPQMLIDRAVALRPRIRAESDAAEQRGCCSEALHHAFVRAGFYRILQPRMFGGLEFSLPVFHKVMIEVSRGDPGIGWCLTLAASHALIVASHWCEQAQRDFFLFTDFFAAPHRPAPMGSATPCGDGYVIEGLWDYCSGIPYATHFIGGAILLDGSSSPQEITFVLPRDRATVLDDWGSDRTIGMRASGSNSVRVNGVFVPKYHTAPGMKSWGYSELGSDGSPGTRLHKTPMFLGQVTSLYQMSLVAPVVGAARAALDVFEQMITTNMSSCPLPKRASQQTDCHRAFGTALVLADTAEAILVRGAESYMEHCDRWQSQGAPFTREDNLRIWATLQQAGQLACQATEIVFTAAGSAATKKGNPIQRYYRDCSMYRGHIASRSPLTTEIARAHLGLPDAG